MSIQRESAALFSLPPQAAAETHMMMNSSVLLKAFAA
jgi:hypothetical protein